MKFGRQWVRVISSVASCSHNEYTKSSLKIQKINNLLLFFQCLLIVSRGWLKVAVEQCYRRDAASLISTLLTLAATDLVTTVKINLPTPPTTFLCLLWSRALLCSIKTGKFIFALWAEGIHSTSRILLYKPCNLCQSLFAKSSATLVYAAFPHLDACIGWLKVQT